MTKKIYEDNPYLFEREATVVSCEREGDLYAIILDETIFCPEGGGQGADKGRIGDAEVVSLKESGGEIIHMAGRPAAVGERVLLSIDFPLRFDRMQNHTGEHILSAAFYKLFGLNNVGFHLGSDFSTIDLDGEVDDAIVSKAEDEANETVFENRPVRCYYPGEIEIPGLDLRKKADIAGELRVVEIDETDRCTCCAPHLLRTGEAGIIKVVRWERYKGGSRVYFLCGKRALLDFREKNDVLLKTAALLSVRPGEISIAAPRLLEENREIKSKIGFLMASIFEKRAAELVRADFPVVSAEDLDAKYLRELAKELSRNENASGILFSLYKGEAAYCLFKGAAAGYDLRIINESIKSDFLAKGGGGGLIMEGRFSFAGLKEALASKLKTYFEGGKVNG